MSPLWTPAAAIDGAELLDAVEDFCRRFSALPSDHAYVAVALWAAHTHFIDCFDSTPRIAFLSPEVGSGKTRALEVLDTLVPRPMQAVNCSPAALFRAVSDTEGRPTVLYDEIDTVFGPKARDNEDLRGLLNAGHRRSGVAYRVVGVGTTMAVKEFPAYAAVALAGLGALPDTLLNRSVVVPMRRRAPSEHVEPFRVRVHEPEGNYFRNRLSSWAIQEARKVTGSWPELPEGVTDREADKWEPLIAIADAAGGAWPQRGRAAAEWFVKEAGRLDRVSLGVRLLLDIRAVFEARGTDRLSSGELLNALHEIDDAPWASLKGEPIDARYLSRTLHNYGDGNGEPIGPTNIRTPFGVAKGYTKAMFFDAWQRYAPATERERNGP
ncbi:DUF3631 domain-containing protein [Streptomyces sp. NBC_00885]|uniref:DUF3631 domain-containing protein n=1 Tax=Streptomyces sp. NBC_00885 TaxID=2975857 RepID=UPI003864FD80|nr:DUF3631 domain-containing protein [Streptomyces sp. NBC_00885]